MIRKFVQICAQSVQICGYKFVGICENHLHAFLDEKAKAFHHQKYPKSNT